MVPSGRKSSKVFHAVSRLSTAVVWAIATLTTALAQGNEAPQSGQISPADGSTGLPETVTLTWTSDALATRYELQVSTSPDFDLLTVSEESLNTTTYTTEPLERGATYYWRVRGHTVLVPGPWSAVWRFTIIVPAPGPPALTSPPDGSADHSGDVLLEWLKAVGAETYDAQVAEEPSFAAPFLDRTGLTDTNVSVAGLAAGESYFWRVRSSNAGGQSEWTSPWTFSMAPVPVQPPTIPTLLSPSDSAEVDPPQVNLVWSGARGAEGFDIQVATDESFTALVVNQTSMTDTSYAFVGFGPGEYFWWRVRSVNADTVSGWTAARTLKSRRPPPGIPALAAPPNGDSTLETTLSVAWYSSAFAESYNLQVSESRQFTSTHTSLEGITDTTWTVANLSSGTTYWWRVQAVNESGTSAWSEEWRIIVDTPPQPPDVPVLHLPNDGEVDVPPRPTLIWFSARDADLYDAQLDSDGTFSDILFERTATEDTTWQTDSLSPGTTYFWRIRGANSVDYGPWSAARSFTTVEQKVELVAPLLIDPANGAIDQLEDITFRWNASAFATGYHLQISDEPGFGAMAVDDSLLADTVRAVTSLSRNTTFYWRVSSLDSSESSPWSETWTFTTVPEPPANPELVSPLDGAIDVSVSPFLEWNAVTGAATYRCQVSKDSAFTTPALDRDSILALTVSVTGLDSATSYYWRVRASNNGGAGSWSSVRTFRTQPPRPGGPELIAPADSTTDVPLSLSLSWRNAPLAERYSVQVSTDFGFTQLMFDTADVAGTSIALNGLRASTTYFWRILAVNVSGAGPWSQTRVFTTQSPTPQTPVLASPLSGTTGLTLPVTLEWNALPGAEKCHVQVSPAPDFTGLVFERADVSTVSVLVDGLERDRTYYWRVRAVFDGRLSSWSSVWEFSTLIPPPPPPSLSMPPHNAVEETTYVVLSWMPGNGAEQYHVQVSSTQDFLSLLLEDSSVVDTSIQVSQLEPGEEYHWRVRGRNEAGPGDWSPPRSFSTRTNEAAAGPSLVSPPNGSSNTSLTPTLSWQSVSGSSSYHVQVDDGPGFSSPEVDDAGVSGTSTTIGPLRRGVVYRWRVRAIVLAFPGDWSEVWTFETIPEVPPAPSPVSPEDFATQQPLDLVLSWSADASATFSMVQVSGTASFATLVAEDSTASATSSRIAGLHRDSTYYWRVRAGNAGGWSSWSTPRQFRTVKDAAPAVLTGPATTIGETYVTLEGTVYANDETTTVAFEYGPDTLYGVVVPGDPVLVTGVDPASVSVSIDSLSPNTLYHYRILASNAVATAYGEDRSFTTPLPNYEETFDVTTEVTFPALRSASEYEPTSYRIVGLPGASNASVRTLLQGNHGVDWQAYWDDGSPSANMIEFDGSSTFTCVAGRAFWLIHRGKWSISSVVPSAPLNEMQEVEIDLHPGWNLITCPFTIRLNWSAVQELNGTAEPIHSYDGMFNQAEWFEPYRGYYFFNRDNRPVLRIPYTSAAASSARSRPPGEAPDWRLRIVLRTAEGVDSSTWVGVIPASIPQKRTRVHKPQTQLAFPGVLLKRPEWDSEYPSFASDFRNDDARFRTWQFEVRTGLLKDAELSFDGLDEIPPALRTVLVDEVRGTNVDLEPGDRYSFRAVQGVTRFTLAVGEPASVEEYLRSTSSTLTYTLGANYPNPFNPSTLIPLELPHATDVVLSIHNILGQTVRILHDGPLPAGKHWFTWNSDDSRGNRVTSGVYLYRAVSPDLGSRVQRMILMK